MDLLKESFENISALGSLVVHGLVGLMFLLIDQAIFLQLLIALSTSVILISITRLFFFKNRPGRSTAPRGLLEKLEASSFPSMHSAHSFIVAIIVGANATTPLLIFLLILAAIIAYSRYYLKMHYAIDILSGILLGSLIGLTTIAFM